MVYKLVQFCVVSDQSDMDTIRLGNEERRTGLLTLAITIGRSPLCQIDP